MEKTEQFTVALPTHVARMIHDRIARGDFASESELLSEAVCGLESNQLDESFERWLASEGKARFDQAQEHPELLISSDKVFAELVAEPDDFSVVD